MHNRYCCTLATPTAELELEEDVSKVSSGRADYFAGLGTVVMRNSTDRRAGFLLGQRAGWVRVKGTGGWLLFACVFERVHMRYP
jgi:hypothetical protein